MSVALDFSPRHEQPFTLEQAMMLEIDMLVAEIARLENSIKHLQETQRELHSFVEEEPEGDDDGEISKAIKENDEVIASQTERITLIKIALLNKVGEGGVKHYGLDIQEDPPGSTRDDPDPAVPATDSSTIRDQSSSTATAPNTAVTTEPEQEGMYL